MVRLLGIQHRPPNIFFFVVEQGSLCQSQVKGREIENRYGFIKTKIKQKRHRTSEDKIGFFFCYLQFCAHLASILLINFSLENKAFQNYSAFRQLHFGFYFMYGKRLEIITQNSGNTRILKLYLNPYRNCKGGGKHCYCSSFFCRGLYLNFAFNLTNSCIK